MDIVKYFYEEPVALETLTPNLEADARQRSEPPMSLEAFLGAPAYYRGYLAGTRLEPLRIGVTALADPSAALGPLLEVLGDGVWQRATGTAAAPLTGAEAAGVLYAPSASSVLAQSPSVVPPEPLQGLAQNPERRETLPALRRLLDEGVTLLFPEPAHHGFDWSLFSPRPLRESLAAAFAAHPAPTARRYVLPYQQARSEEKFYFEQYDLARYAAFEIP